MFVCSLWTFDNLITTSFSMVPWVTHEEFLGVTLKILLVNRALPSSAEEKELVTTSQSRRSPRTAGRVRRRTVVSDGRELYKVTGQYFFFRVGGTSSHIYSPLLTFFLCFIVLFLFCCSHARVFGKTLVHEFLISYGHTEWILLSSGTEESHHKMDLVVACLPAIKN